MRLFSIFSASPVHCVSISSFFWPADVSIFSSCSVVVWNCWAIILKRESNSAFTIEAGSSTGFFSTSCSKREFDLISFSLFSKAVSRFFLMSFFMSSRLLYLSLTSWASSSSSSGTLRTFTAVTVTRTFLFSPSTSFVRSFVSPFFIPMISLSNL